MMRLPRVASACRFFPENLLDLHRPTRIAAVVAAGLALSICNAPAQTPAKGSPDHVKAVTSAVDGASIRANTALIVNDARVAGQLAVALGV